MSIIETLRKPKIHLPFFNVNVAIFDTVGSLYIGYKISEYYEKPYYYSFLVIPAGYLTHKIVGVETPLNKAIDKKLS